MRVLMAASEVVPYAKTGGLGDVLGALPSALQRLGIEVSIVMPAYRSIDAERFGLLSTGWTLDVPISQQTVHAGVLRSPLDGGVSVYFIDAPQYFARQFLYGTTDGPYLDNAERFAFFSRAVLALTEHVGAPDILHCHDWQAALAPAFLRADAAHYPTLAPVRTVMTIHNLGYQGLFWHFDWHLLNLDWSYFTPSFLEFYGKINYLKGGIVFADAVTTVSPTYAREIQTAAFGDGLDGVLVARRHALSGILNGVDYGEWSPEHDTRIAAPYTVDDRSGKAACKADLQATMQLPVDPRVPVIGMVSRLADQKGLDLIAAIAPQLLRKRVQLVVLGSGEARYETLVQQLAHKYPERVAVRVAFDDALAHKIEAGSDLFLMPSRYEPCGLNQIYSLRYGTIPIVRATGGLEDTIIHFDPRSGAGTGFKFADYAPAALLACIEEALQTYRRPKAWAALIGNAMRADFSWERSAEAYAQLYRQVSGAS
jgi:starch synthase